MRYFSAPSVVAQAMRLNVMAALGQPNGQADEPWGVYGDFAIAGTVYLALGPHHTEGDFWGPLIASALASGVSEITATKYEAARVSRFAE